MKENWLKDVHDKMAGFEADEPRGLWDDICRARGAANTRKPVRTARLVRMWSGGVAAAAAVAGIVCLVVPRNDGNGSRTARPVAAVAPAARPLTPPAAPQQVPPVAQTAGSAAATMHNGASPAADMGHATTAAATRAADTLSAGESSPRHSSTDTPRTPASLPATDEAHPRPDARAALASAGRHRQRRLAVSVYMDGATGSSLSHRYISNHETAGLGPGNSDWDDNPLLGIIAYNQGKEVEKKVHHHLPLKTGVSLAWPLSPRVSLATGLTYAYLRTDFRDGGNTHYLKQQQQLHYVGIPLAIQVNALAWKNLTLYASAGLLAEQCVAGKLETEYVLDNKQKASKSENIATRPFLFSVNASAGLQYNFTNNVALFAEPGVSYFFNDGSSLNTIYKEKPLQFNLHLGLRISFRK